MMNNYKPAFKAALPGVFLLVLFILISLFSYKKYGISWDEPVQRDIGIVSYNYVTKGDPQLFDYIERDHGVGFEVPLIFIEKGLALKDSRDIYLMRHLVTHLFFLMGAFAFYLLAWRLFRNRWLAALAFLLLVLHPRIYAHSFFNTKDVPFLVLFIVSLLAVQIAFEKDRIRYYLLAGAACGYTTGIRIMSILLAGLLLLFFAIDIIRAYRLHKTAKRQTGRLLVFIAGFVLSLYISWPYLWTSPVDHFLSAYNSMAHFRWDGRMLFEGKRIWSLDLPWYYLPKWIAITTPVLFLLTGAAGMALIMIRTVKNPSHFIFNTPDRNFLLYFLCCTVSVLMVIVMRSVVYDDWRHLYYIYPCFVLTGIYAAQKVTGIKAAKYAGGALMAIQLGTVTLFMVKNHPFQQVYFNELVQHGKETLRQEYEMDYWGSSYSEALQYIAAHDTSPDIKLLLTHSTLAPLENNLLLLPPVERRRFRFVPVSDHPDYYITNFRYIRDPEADYESNKNIYFNIKIINSSFIRVYKL